MKKQILLFITGCLLISVQIYPQVGINTEDPNSLTELDITNLTGADGKIIPKGIMIPRLTEAQRDAIDVSETNAPNSLLIYNTDEDCYNYYSLLAGEWQSLCGKLGKAQFTMDCASIAVSGQYLNNTSLNTGHYIKVTLDVTKAGAYDISAIADPDNGYYFYAVGEFLTTGTFDIYLQGAGTPINFTPTGEEGDLIKFYLQSTESQCTTHIKVEDSSIEALYSMVCSSVQTHGVYKVNTTLDASNYITLQLDVDPAATGATYMIETNTVDGIKFSGAGILIGGIQTVTLYGSGKPTSFVQKTLTINNNSTSNVESCLATVIIAYSKKKILSIGTYANDSYGYNWSGSDTNTNRMVTAASNYGTLENSIVKVDGIEFIRTGDFAPTTAQLQTALNEKPDIVTIGVWWNPSTEQAQLLVDYMAKGGVLLAYTEEAGTSRMLQSIFGQSQVNTSDANSSGAVYKFPYVNDEILNGPFGDIRGLQWGEDASATEAISNIPTSQVTIYSYAADVSGTSTAAISSLVTAFRHNTLNLIFVCDGGFNSGTNISPSDPYICPFNIDNNYFPIPKQNFGRGTTKFSVYNSTFTANALAWALRQAQFNGINPAW